MTLFRCHAKKENKKMNTAESVAPGCTNAELNQDPMRMDDSFVSCIGTSFNTTGIYGYVYHCDNSELVKMKGYVVPKPTIQIQDGAKKLYHKDFDPELTLFTGAKRYVVDENDEVDGYFEFVTAGSYQIHSNETVLTVNHADQGWEIYNGDDLVADIEYLDRVCEVYYEEDGFLKKDKFRVFLKKDSSEELRPYILAIPMLGF